MVSSAPLSTHRELVVPVGGAMTRFLGWDRPARYVLALLLSVTAAAGFAPTAPTVRIHYHRDVPDYTGWQLYTWYGALNPSPQWNPAQPPTAPDGFGVYYDVAVNTADTGLNFILHDASGNNKNCPNDMFFPFPPGIKTGTQNLAEIWQLVDATGLQIPGVLDSLCTYSGKLGAVVSASDPGDPAGGMQFRLWAPTAKSVNLYVYDSPTSPPSKFVPMSWNSDTCVWTADGNSSWANRKYYKYEVRVFVR